MRFLTSAAVVVSLAAASFVSTAPASASPDACRRSDGNGFSDRDVKQTIRCAVGFFPVPGGYRKAASVARCESGFDERNRNPASSAAGVFQVISGTWRGLLRRYRAVRRRFDLRRSAYNARANVVLAIRYAHASGWSPWVCG